MHLSGWIGQKKARERHVFTLQAMELCRLEIEKAKSSTPPALARAFRRLQHFREKIPEVPEIAISRSPNPFDGSLSSMAPINLRRLVTIPVRQVWGVYYATIIQHYARNLHENPHLARHPTLFLRYDPPRLRT
jgi:hypothetical protein